MIANLSRFPTAAMPNRDWGEEEPAMVRRSIITAAVLSLLAPATATAGKLREEYVDLRVEAESQDLRVGRDIRHGVRSPSGKIVRAKPRHFAEKIREFRELFDPEPVASGGGGGSPIPGYIVQCESGGDYNAVNPSSGAYGKYQIMPFHWNGGICSDLDRSPAGQDKCAARIWETSGPGAWSCA